MKEIYVKISLRRLLSIVFLLAMVGNAWGTDVTGTIYFGSGTGDLNVNSASVSGNDSQSNSWTVTTVGTTSFTPNADYAQIGSSKSAATSITFTTTLPASQTISSFSAKFSGFGGSAGTVTLKVGDTTVGTGSLNGTTDVTVSNTNSTTSGTVLTVTVTGISKGVKAYYISYTYKIASGLTPLSTPTNLTSSKVTDCSATLSWDAVSNVSCYAVKIGSSVYNTNTNSYSATGLTDSTPYTWSVMAIGDGSTYDNSTYANEQQFTTTAFVPTAGTYNIVPNNIFWGNTQNGSVNVKKNTSFGPETKYGVSVSMNSGNSTNSYMNSELTRVYNGYAVTIAAPTGFLLTSIVFTGDTWVAPTASVGTMNNNEWNGNANSVTFTFTGTSYMSNIAVTYATASLSATISAAGYATFVPNKNVTVPEDVTAYAVKVEGSVAKLNAVNAIPANTAVVIKGGEGTYYFPVTSESVETIGTDLKYSDSNITANGSQYILAKKDGVVGFYKATTGTTIKAGKAYLENSSNVKSITFEEVTGVNTIANSVDVNAPAYNLRGQRVSADYKGIVIKNGKKYLNK